MNVLVDIGHPAHVHFFKHAIRIWRQHGHGVRVVCRRIPIVERLLRACGLDYEVVSRKRSGALGLGIELAEHASRLFPRLRRWRIDVCAAVGGTFTVHAARAAGCRCVVFYDTDTATAANRITYPFASRIVTPDVYPRDLGAKHVRYRGFQELAYLHPDRFTPRPEVPAKYGLPAGAPYSVVRFCAWQASHDIGVRPASWQEKRALIGVLKERGNVILVPEAALPAEFRSLAPPLDPEDFHDLLAFASCCVTEGATTASEACMLGVPTLYINPIRPCYIPAMEQYGLLRAVRPGEDMTGALRKLLDQFRDAGAAARAAQKILADHADVTPIVVETVETASRRCQDSAAK